MNVRMIKWKRRGNMEFRLITGDILVLS